MNKKDYLISTLFFFIGFFSRIPFLEKMQSHWDGPQYSIAILRYSLSQQTPAIPGYPLYIAFGRFFLLFTADPHQALLMVDVFFAGITALLFYTVGKTIFNRITGCIAGLLYLTGATFFYFGLTPYPYGEIPALTLLLALVIYKIVMQKKKKGFLLGLITAFFFGFRPQDFFIIPFFTLYGFYFLSKKQKITAVVSFIFCTLTWFLPFMLVVGGVKNYIHILSLSSNAQNLSLFSLEIIKGNARRIVQGYFLSFGLAEIFALYYIYIFLNKYSRNIKSVKKLFKSKLVLFFSFWIVPSLLFNIFIRSDHAGYQMIYLSALLLLLANAIEKINRNNMLRLLCILFILCSFNLWWFFRSRDPQMIKPYTPTSFHYSEIVKNDKRMSSQIKFISNNYSPKTTLIITIPDLWRPIMYYLKPYEIYEFDVLSTSDPKFQSIRRDAKNWNFVEYQKKDYIFTVPENVTTMIFLDDNTDVARWFTNFTGKTVTLDANAKITYIQVSSGDKFSYKYHTITKL